MSTKTIAILTDRNHVQPDTRSPYECQILLEEAWLIQHFAELGFNASRVAWDDASIDWSQFQAAIFRSTWDYFDRYAEFSPWLDEVARKVKLINRYDLLSWNMDKHYLLDLAEQHIAIVPTKLVEKGSSLGLASLLHTLKWQDAIIKPTVSGSARLTYRIHAPNLAEHQAIFDQCLKTEDMMVQRFIPSVLDQGEISLIVIAGQVTHAIRKTPKAGDFRVQDDHGGTVHPHNASPAEIRFAEQAVAACPVQPHYARVDIVYDGDTLRIMEMELVEPELFFRFKPSAARALAQAVVASLGEN